LIIFIINYPPIQEIFELAPLEIADWIIVIVLSTTGFAYSEIIKLFNKDKINKIGQQASITTT
jgi:hypothetical protein